MTALLKETLLKETVLNRLRPLARWVPARLRHPMGEALRGWRLGRAVEALKALPPGRVPPAALLAELRAAWSNTGYAARDGYLQELAEHAATTPGPILECGSGVTTLLLGLLAGRRGVETWALEHLPQWHARVGSALERHRIPGVHGCLAPLQGYEGFHWYAPPLERMPGGFQLIVCDGPPGDTPGGRYGLWPVLGSRLARGAVVLLDDSDRPGEREVLQRWQAEAGARVERTHGQPGSAWAVVRVG